MRHIIFNICAAVYLLCTATVEADSAYFTVQVQADMIRVSSEIRYAQDTPYVSLNDILLGLGGGIRVMPERIQANLNEVTAVLGINSVSVALPGTTFALVYPARVQDETVFIALSDVTDFLARAYQMRIVRVEQAQQLPELTAIAPNEATPPDEEEGDLLETVELPPLVEAEEKVDEPLMEEITEAPEAPVEEFEETAAPPGQLDEETLGRIQGTVTLDPGHGGADAGISVGAGPAEKDLVLDLALRLRRILKETTGIVVYMTRDSDNEVSLAERAAEADRYDSDLLLSLHMGYSAAYRAQGVVLVTDLALETASSAMTDEHRERLAARHRNAEMANAAAWHLAQSMQSNPLGPVVTRVVPLLLQRESDAPCILVEAAYLSNQDNISVLDNEENLEELARALAVGVAATLYTR